MGKRTIGFFHDIDDPKYWKDGLWAALEVLKNKYNIKDNEQGEVNIVWTGSEGPAWKKVHDATNIIWLYAGGNPIQRDCITVVEEGYAQEQFARIGVSAHIALGTNTDLFYRADVVHKWDVIFPAAFAAWKRHDLLVKWAKGFKVLCVGYKQQVETECYKICEEAGFEVMDRVIPEVLADMYRHSRECWIPTSTVGGSQRTVLEALASGCRVKVADDNPRLQRLMQLRVPSHYEYAHKLDEIISSTT